MRSGGVESRHATAVLSYGLGIARSANLWIAVSASLPLGGSLASKVDAGVATGPLRKVHAKRKGTSTVSAPRFTKAQKDEIVRRHLAGENRDAIAKDFGCDPSYPDLLTKRRWIADAGHSPSWIRLQSRKRTKAKPNDQ